MRRLVAVALASLLAVGLGVTGAPSTDAQTVLPPGQYLWATTSTQTLVYDRSTIPPTLVASTDNNPSGNLVRDPTNDYIYVATQGGIDAFQGLTAEVIFGMGDVSYQQVVATPDGSKVYGLQTGGEVIDVFSGVVGTLITSISLQGRATGMSDPRPPNGDVIVIGSIYNTSADNYDSAYITTADDNLVYFNLATQDKVNGTAWSPDGTAAYLATESLDTPAAPGSIGRYEPLTGLTEFPLAAGVTPRQIAISPDGGQLLVPGDDLGLSSIQFVDTATMATTGSAALGATTWGFPAVAPDGTAYFPQGPDGVIGTVLILDDGGFSVLSTGIPPVIGVLVADRPAAVQATSGAGQRMYVSRVFDAPLVATVVDPAGTPLPGHYVSFQIQSNSNDPPHFNAGGLIFNGLTGPDGTLATPLIVAGPTPETFTVLASIFGLPAAAFSLDIVPDALPPTITSLTAGDGTVVVEFAPPTGLITPVTAYQVVATDVTEPTRGGQVALGVGSPLTVTGLTNGDTYTFTVTAFTTEVDLPSAPSERINVGIPASITGTPLAGEVGQPYQFTFTVVGAPTPTVSLDVGTPLPAGLTFDPTTATIAGTPTTAGSTFLLVSAVNALASSLTGPTLVIDLAASNRPPVAADDAASVRPGATTRIDPRRNDSDPDAGTALGLPTITSPPSLGTATVGADGIITYVAPPRVASGTVVVIVYSVCDQHGACATATIRITISSSGGLLPATGTGTAALLALAACFVVAGVGARRTARRHPRPTSPG